MVHEVANQLIAMGVDGAEVASPRPEEVLSELLVKYKLILIVFVTAVVLVKVICRIRRFVRDRDVEPVPYTCLYIGETLAFTSYACMFVNVI